MKLRNAAGVATLKDLQELIRSVSPTGASNTQELGLDDESKARIAETTLAVLATANEAIGLKYKFLWAVGSLLDFDFEFDYEVQATSIATHTDPLKVVVNPLRLAFHDDLNEATVATMALVPQDADPSGVADDTLGLKVVSGLLVREYIKIMEINEPSYRDARDLRAMRLLMDKVVPVSTEKAHFPRACEPIAPWAPSNMAVWGSFGLTDRHLGHSPKIDGPADPSALITLIEQVDALLRRKAGPGLSKEEVKAIYAARKDVENIH